MDKIIMLWNQIETMRDLIAFTLGIGLCVAVTLSMIFWVLCMVGYIKSKINDDWGRNDE